MKLVLCHGWGMDSAIWQALLPELPSHWQLSCLQWPGYGGTAELAPEQWLPWWLEQLQEDAHYLGWSLGALYLQQLMLASEAKGKRVRGCLYLSMAKQLVLPGGLCQPELTQFSQAFARQPLAAWRHFCRWQLRGETHAQQCWQQLQRLYPQPPASQTTLAQGLIDLAQLRMQSALCSREFFLLGAQDPLMAQGLDYALYLPEVGHCPQLSQPQQLAQQLVALLGDTA